MFHRVVWEVIGGERMEETITCERPSLMEAKTDSSVALLKCVASKPHSLAEPDFQSPSGAALFPLGQFPRGLQSSLYKL